MTGSKENCVGKKERRIQNILQTLNRSLHKLTRSVETSSLTMQFFSRRIAFVRSVCGMLPEMQTTSNFAWRKSAQSSSHLK